MSQPETATPISAIVFVFAAGLLFSCLDAGAKYLVLDGFAAPFVAWVRFAVHAVMAPILLGVWSNPDVLKVRSLKLQLLRGAFLFGSTIFNFLALQTLQLADTISIFFFGPMVITALAGPLLGEWAGWRRWMAVLGGFIGVLIITRPGSGVITIGHAYVMAATLSYSFYVIMTRRMGATETAASLIFYSSLAPAILMLPALPLAGSMPHGALQWTLLLSLGFFGGFGHFLLIKAYQRATTAALAPYPYLQMIWMVSLGYVVFGQLPDRWTLAGAAVIAMSGLYIVHRERVLRLKSAVAAGETA